MILYHGTHKRHEESIKKEGLKLIDTFISLTPRFDVAVGYASMSGEKAFRAAGRRAKHVPIEDRIVIVVDLPRSVKYQVRGGGLLPRHEYRVFESIKPEWIVKIKYIGAENE